MANNPVSAYSSVSKNYSANPSTKDAKSVKVPILLLQMGTTRFGAGGRSVNSARKKIQEVFEHTKKITEAHVEEIKAKILDEAKVFMEGVAGHGQSKYAANNKIFQADEHSLEWMKFGTSDISSAAEMYNARRKNLRKNLSKEELEALKINESFWSAKKRRLAKHKGLFNSIDAKQMKKNMFKMLGMLLGAGGKYSNNSGKSPYAKRNPTYTSLGHTNWSMYHIQNSGGTGRTNLGESISKYVLVKYDADRNTHKLMVEDSNAAKIFTWLEKGTTKSNGKGEMIGRGNLKRALSKQIKNEFIPNVVVPMVEKYFKKIRSKK